MAIKTQEHIFYIRIVLFNSNKEKPLFNWSGTGNLLLALAIAQEEVERKIPLEREGHYNIEIKIRNNKTSMDEYVWSDTQGRVRQGIKSADMFVQNKLGYDITKCIKYNMQKMRENV